MTTKVLIYLDAPQPEWSYLPWLLNDPLLLAVTSLSTDVRVADAEGKRFFPDLSRAALAGYDLVMVPFRHSIRDRDVVGILDYLDSGGALVLVQPVFDSEDVPTALADRLGVTSHGWQSGMPYYSFSLVTDHPAARVLGQSEGSSAYPHTAFAPHLVFEVGDGAVLTRTSPDGAPDIFISSRANVALVATDVFHDLEAHQKSGPVYYTYRRNLVSLLLNTVRVLLGHEAVTQPIQKPQQRWGELLSAYAAGREYVVSVQQAFADRLSADELAELLADADDLADRSAKAFTSGEVAAGQELFESAVRVLSDGIGSMTSVQRHVYRGWQANALYDHDYGGGLLGFAQAQWIDLLLEWMTLQLDWVERTGTSRVHALSSMTWEVMAKYYPHEVGKIRKATSDGHLEAVSGLYTQAYLPLISAESNVRQFSLGHRELKKHLDTEVQVFLEPRDHFNFHPQLPQILADFGIRYAVLRCLGHLGEITPVRADTIRWRGIDGTEIHALPTYEGIRSPHLPQFWFDPGLLAKADELGYDNLLLGDSFDSTLDYPGEKEHTILNAIAPISGTWTTPTDFFQRVPEPDQVYDFGVDDLYARLMEVWSSFGNLNEAYGWNRATESLILAAEKFGAIADVLDDVPDAGRRGAQGLIERSWKNLLATQDRMAFGSVDYDAQDVPSKVVPGEEKQARHYRGFQLGLLPQQEKFTTMGMENLQEMLTENYAGPMVPVGRHTKVVESLDASRRDAGRVLDDALARISGNIDANGGPGDGAVPVVVFNQLGWRKSDIVAVEREFDRGAARGVAIYDGDQPMTHQITDVQTHDDGSIRRVSVLFAADVPSLGYKTYYMKPLTEEKP